MQLDLAFPKINRTYIEVVYRKVYGNRRFYPKSQDAKLICTLLGSKTLTEKDLRACKEGGWEVQIIEPKYVLR